MATSSNDQDNELLILDMPSPTASDLAVLGNFDLNEGLTIIAQPSCSSKVRYRKDYLSDPKRRDPLIGKNTNHKVPATNIPFALVDTTDVFYIGVSLATVLHEKTNCRYVHPYELESIDDNKRNDTKSNIVWYQIVSEDSNGIKSFPDLRIIRKKEDELEECCSLRPFHGFNSNILNNSLQKELSKRQIVPEYDLKKAQLAFFIGQKTNVNDEFPVIIQHDSIIFSDVMILLPDTPPTKPTTTASPPAPPECHMSKYAPRYGYANGGEEMIILFSSKIEEKKYGKLRIIFESDTSNINWSAEVKEIEVKNTMVSFRVPKFPYPINEQILMKIILQQRDRTIKSLEYHYIPKFSPPSFTCQAATSNPPTLIARTNSNKRTKTSLNAFDDAESDGVVPISETNPVFQQSKSEPGSVSSNSISQSTYTTDQTKQYAEIVDRIDKGIESLFTTDDLKPLSLVFRSLVLQHPERFHQAIDKNYSDLLSKFIPIAGVKLLQHKNELGETALLQATRLNQLNTIQTILDRDKSEKFLDDTNEKQQNIFHILALHSNSNEIFDLLINYLLKHSINISDKFDKGDKDNYTPLQLAIVNKNLSITREFLKHFNKNIRDSFNHIGDNLIHLAVRSGDMTILEYLLNDEQLIEQGNRSNITMTPLELARSMKHDDMVEYLEKIYPQPIIDKEESSDSD